MSLEELESELLKLDTRERARLAERLLNSLENLAPAEIERLWADEALRRLEEIGQGKAKTRSAEDVLRDVNSRLG
jgi:putative addiction module component (TIGR02574 family)